MQQQVEEFHKAFGLGNDLPLDEADLMLRRKLIREEVEELDEEIIFTLNNGKIHPNLLKEAADVLYVVVGLCVHLGIDVEEAFNRVHASNMSKLDENGRPIYRADGKALKGPNYKPPNLEDLVT